MGDIEKRVTRLDLHFEPMTLGRIEEGLEGTWVLKQIQEAYTIKLKRSLSQWVVVREEPSR